MKDLFKSEYTVIRNRTMLFVLSAVTVLVFLSMLNNNLVNKQPETGVTNYAGNFGADFMKVDSVIARQFGVPAEGVIINRVYPNTRAAEAGLQRGDIIVAINSSPVTSVSIVKSLLFIVDTKEPLKITVLRGEQEMSLTVSPGSSVFPLAEKPPEASIKHYVVASVIFISVFSLLFFSLADRVVVITLGAVVMIIAGGYSGFYSQEAAFGSIKLNVLSLLLGLNLVTIVLERAGFFEYLGNRALIFANNDVHRITIVFCLATFLFSAFVNNLTTIMVLLPVSLSLIKNMPIDPGKFLFCQITASNLGGASTMIGDFPNMLISSEKGVMFHDFIFNMTPITVILLVIMLFYFRPGMKTEGSANIDAAKLIEEARQKVDTSIKDYPAVSRGLIILAILIIGFMLSDTIDIRPSTLAIAGGFLLLLFDPDPSDIIKNVCFKDIIFFCSLFVLVGGIHATGLLENIAYGLSMAAGENMFLKLVCIMILAALCTSFLNAGPSTALFLPIVSSMAFPGTSYIVWWALSIGVCIGSSATLTGATAGPVAISLYEKFMKNDPSVPVENRTLSFMAYTKTGLPLMGIFTLVSIIYIGILSFVSQ